MNLVLQDPRAMPSPEAWALLCDRDSLKTTYNLDVMAPIPLYFDTFGRHVVGLEGLSYFFSFFSHTRPDYFGFPVWKGMIQLELSSNSEEDEEAISLLEPGVES